MEYKAFKGIKFEIQIRSILQHTWAEIEHDIGYKSKLEIPRDIRRQFSRLAGLLEIADNEFVNIKNSLNQYEIDVEEKIKITPEIVLIDTITLTEFIKTDEFVSYLDDKIVNICNFVIQNDLKNDLSHDLKIINYLGIKTISELKNKLKDNERNILIRAKDVGDMNNEVIFRGISIFYLLQVLAIKGCDKDKLKEFIQLATYPMDSFDSFWTLSQKLK